MSNPASPDDIQARWRPLNPQESLNAQTFLDDALGILKRRIPDLETLVAGDSEYCAAVVRVMATAVIRVLKNPDGAKRESIDDYSWERDATLSSGELFFTDEELNDLDPGAGFKGRAFTADPLAGRDWSDWS